MQIISLNSSKKNGFSSVSRRNLGQIVSEWAGTFSQHISLGAGRVN